MNAPLGAEVRCGDLRSATDGEIADLEHRMHLLLRRLYGQTSEKSMLFQIERRVESCAITEQISTRGTATSSGPWSWTRRWRRPTSSRCRTGPR
jgi:anti-sigma-K factor RskA